MMQMKVFLFSLCLLVAVTVVFCAEQDPQVQYDLNNPLLKTPTDEIYFTQNGYLKSKDNKSNKIKYISNQETWDGEILNLSWKPRANLYKNFLTKEECEHIIAEGKGRLQKSDVVDSETGKSVPSDVRTSSGTWFGYGYDAVILGIEKRIAFVTMAPQENQEPLQLLHYIDGQKYEAHWDYFLDHANATPELGGQRYLTVLMYLTDVVKGGETVFPRAEAQITHSSYSPCAQSGLAVKPEQGDALIFHSLTPSGLQDESSLHQSCPVIEGDKYTATKWIRQGRFNMPQQTVRRL